MLIAVFNTAMKPSQEEVVGVVISMYSAGHLHTAEGVFRAFRDRLKEDVAERIEREMFNGTSDVKVVIAA